ncbi:MAG: S41 family peptidase [Acidobacteriota bacterium]
MTKYKANKDKEFKNGSGIGSVKLTRMSINDLVVLGKIWGFLKYYHPAIAAGNHHWDFELFRVLPEILDSRTKAKRNSVLSSWLKDLGPFLIASGKKKPARNIKLRPDLRWIKSRTFGEKLTQQLNRVGLAKRSDENYYVALDPGAGNPRFDHEDAYESMLYPDTGFRILSLFRYWNIIQYFFPHRHLIAEGWNNVLPAFIARFVDAPDKLEYTKTVLALIARVHDTHANIWGMNETLERYRGINAAPVSTRFVEDKAVVARFLDQARAKKSGVEIGDVIETINGQNVDDIVSERLDLTPASNYTTQLRDVACGLLRTNDPSLEITFTRGGGAVRKARLKCYPNNKLKVHPSDVLDHPRTAFRQAAAGISYLYPGCLKPGEIDRLIPKFARNKGLIIDLRTYPSDFIVYSLGEFLMPKATPYFRISMASIETPGQFTLEDALTVGKDNAEYYKGKVVILINEITQSQAEFTAMAFRKAPRATVIGGTTAGADGNISPFYLPGGIRTMISGIGIYYPDGKETQRIGIIPDIVVNPTIKGIAARKDELLDKAIEIAGQDQHR